jgi:virulence-associated protein VagC
MATAKLFTLGNSQAVRIPARYRIAAAEVEIFQRDGELVLRPKRRTAADVFAAVRSMGADWSDVKRPAQGDSRSVPAIDD